MNRSHYKDEKAYRVAKMKERERYYGESSFRYKARAYSEEEEYLILNSKKTDRELSYEIQRSVKAIQNKRIRLKSMIKKEEGSKKAG